MYHVYSSSLGPAVGGSVICLFFLSTRHLSYIDRLGSVRSSFMLTGREKLEDIN